MGVMSIRGDIFLLRLFPRWLPEAGCAIAAIVLKFSNLIIQQARNSHIKILRYNLNRNLVTDVYFKSCTDTGLTFYFYSAPQ